MKQALLIVYIIILFLSGEILAFYFNWSQLNLMTQAAYADLNATPLNQNQPTFNNVSLPVVADKKIERILFVGDMMFDRGVETLMTKNGLDYPFAKIKDFLTGQDLVVANLEGPIVNKPKDFGPHAMTFAFAPQVANLLSDNHLDLVSLANNHSLNMGQIGLAETRSLLQAAGIGYLGDPLKCSADLTYSQADFIFLAFNKIVAGGCSDKEIQDVVKAVKAENTDKFIIAFMHWGSEYQTNNSLAQQKLGHELIDVGADLIIGSHPHVVQNIEQYKNKLIFYSLGNFIFDQYFNQKVQQGLAIGLEVAADKITYNLYPLQSKSSQASLMTETANFLNDLAGNSSLDLKVSIAAGKIEIPK